MEKVPSTPPPQQRFTLETPSTPLVPQHAQFLTPQTVKTHSKRVLSSEIPVPSDLTHHHLLGTPETTPRKRQIDSGKNAHHILFPISQSTVGTGRRYSNNAAANTNHFISNRTTGLLDLKSTIKIEIGEEEEEEEEEDDDDEELMNYSSSDEQSNALEIKRKLNLNSQVPATITEPCTPPSQIIDDEFIMNMNIETCHDSDELEDVANDINKSTPNLINPFSSDHSSRLRKQQPNDPRFTNEIEMIYHSTGEHFWVPQDNLGLNIKPTNLLSKLTNVIDSPLKSRDFDMSNLLRTPKLQQDKSLIDDLNSTDEDEKDLIQQEVESTPSAIKSENNIPNPFNSHAPQPPRTPRKLGVLRRVEYINQSSGDKREIDLNEDEMIKPKRLNFS